MALKEMIQRYEELREQKKTLESELDAVKEEFNQIKQDIADQMIEDDMPQIGVGEYVYSLKVSKQYNFKSQAELAEAGLDKFAALRENGYGFLIVERVDSRSLNKNMQELAENAGELPEGLEAVLQMYEVQDIGRKKNSSKALKTAKGIK